MKDNANPIYVSNNIGYDPVFQGCTGQDGAIYGDTLFRFGNDGSCTVYSLKDRCMVAQFVLDKADVLKPHSNSVSFGAERFAADDEFPLLYTNIYNSYAKAPDRREGMCCVYRIWRDGDTFASQLVQVIRIGFVEQLSLWKSLPGNGDVRPYGNFVADAPAGRLYAFTMRDAERCTRYFEFALPALTDGTFCPEVGANVVTLQPEDILSAFDGDYANYMQGACAYGGMLFSTEGFTATSAESANKPRLQVIDMRAHKKLADVDLYAAGLTIEPELIDLAGDRLCFMDASGMLYELHFR